MSEKPISPLRQRMLEDMGLRGFTPDTQRDYIRAVKKLAAYLGRSPDTATAEDLRAFQLHLIASGVQPPTINTTVTVLRFFFKVTLDRPETTRHLVFVYEPRKLPRVLSPEEVLHLLEAAPGPKHKAALSVAYGNRGNPPYEEVRHYFFDMGNDSLPAFFEIPKGKEPAGNRNAIGAMQHCAFVVTAERFREVEARLKSHAIDYIGPICTAPRSARHLFL